MAPYTGVGNYKGVWWMPRLMKGDEGRGVAAIRFGEVPSNLRSGDVRMGKPTGKKFSVFCSNAESKPWEVKHLKTNRNFVSSGERTRITAQTVDLPKLSCSNAGESWYVSGL